MGAMAELVRPPAHRGPLIAMGAVMLTVGVALEQVRLSPGAGVQLVIVAALAALLLGLALGIRTGGGRPPSAVSVLVVCGLGALYAALLRLADVLGADFGLPAGAFAWTAAVEALAAAFVSLRRGSAIAMFVAALAAGLALLAGWKWLFDPGSVTPYRWLALLVALTFAVGSLALRGASQRHAVQMVNAAGVAILVIPALQVRLLAVAPLPGFWTFVLLAAGFGLVAFAAVDGAPGPAYLGVLTLAVFVAFDTLFAGDTLRWWPLVLLAGGALVLAIGLRPRAPLPPEPQAYRKDDVPLASRTGGDAMTSTRWSPGERT